ncbi:MAG: TM0106 family RecB-like putative nuclease [Vulcanimicrobiaceae bacterium]
MQRIDGCFVYSASDLNDFLECAHLSELERAIAQATRKRPENDDTIDLLARKGEEHELRHFEYLRQRYGDALIACTARGESSREAWLALQRQTLEAMRSGAAIIYQATFFDGTFIGRADFLRRVERPSRDWRWSYEAIETKLALSPKPTYLVQLCNYSEHLERLQGVLPRDMYVVLGSGNERAFRTDSFMAYYRHLKASFLERMGAPASTYPSQKTHCVVCGWRSVCEAQRDADDHLSLVASIRGDHIAKLQAHGITTLARLAQASDAQRPFGMAAHSFDTLRSQAALQHVQRTEHRHVYELLTPVSGSGFERMPEPNEGDLFFDMEGDPLYEPGRGLEYLFGAYLAKEQEYRGFWAHDAREERVAFERFIDFASERRTRYPGMHIYHYAPYETTALRRLMGFYGTRERELDELLRGQVFIDLYAVVRQAIRVSQPSYSIKKLEAFYGFSRSTKTQRGDDSIVMFESWLFNGDRTILDDIERYNDDDCRSTHRLRDWLLQLRSEQEAKLGRTLPWRAASQAEESPESDRSGVVRRLLDGIEPPQSLRSLRNQTESVRAPWLLAALIEYHRREAKPGYWQLHDRHENIDRLLEFDHEALAGLELCTGIPPERAKQSFIYTYAFPEQQYNLGTDSPYCPERKKPAGTVVEIDDRRRLVRIKLNRSIVPDELHALIPGAPMQTSLQRAALARIADAYLHGRLEFEYPATCSLLLARAPRFSIDRGSVQPERVDARSVGALVQELDRSHLVVQGPPGSGKSTIGASVIVDLLAGGKRVGILATGHKAIHNLLRKVEETAAERGVRFRGLQKSTKGSPHSTYSSPLNDPMVVSLDDAAAFATIPHELAAGTSWLFSREDVQSAYDVLFIDEAGQMSLADAIASSLCATNIVLLGDPLQLAQVSLGSHPVGGDLSVLEHLLGDDETIQPSRGVFLDISYRMHPWICSFISHALYDDRLHAAPACIGNRIESVALDGAGLFYLPVAHVGNSRASNEEAQAVMHAITALLRGTYTLGERAPLSLTAADIVVVSPYNAQRKLLRAHLQTANLETIRVGTVDAFQGQEAPVVLYSMATSSGAELPRDMAFLFEKNRLNVAISRAQCASILVCSPELLDVRCTTPEQMALANLLCSFVEAARVLAVPV